MPIGRPGELTETGNGARIFDARQAFRLKLSPSARRPAVITRSSAAVSPVRRWVKQSVNCLRDFRQQIDDANAWKHNVERAARLLLPAALPFLSVTSRTNPHYVSERCGGVQAASNSTATDAKTALPR